MESVFSHPLFPVLTFFLGLLLGHRFALHRDKRKELNDAIEPVRQKLRRIVGDTRPGVWQPTDAELDLLLQCLPWWRRGNFTRSYEQYEKECANIQRDGFNQADYVNPEKVAAAAQRCVKALTRT